MKEDTKLLTSYPTAAPRRAHAQAVVMLHTTQFIRVILFHSNTTITTTSIDRPDGASHSDPALHT